ncbi:MAG: hypothetical protein A2Z29_02740 [Chloroflexi bacterium RBG_16_56_11]|nr:MAG: hypothetical protein A2Z29_02740 [Chloroflexi bacterium RBG_16_56_11]
MSTSKNKAVMHRVFEEVLSKGNLAIIPELIAPDYVFRSPLGIEIKGPEGFKQNVTMYRTAFPDIHATINDVIAEGDKVAVRYSMTGNFNGPMMGIAPTGKRLETTGAVFVRFAGGREVEASSYTDMFAWYQQLGIKPPGM